MAVGLTEMKSNVNSENILELSQAIAMILFTKLCAYRDDSCEKVKLSRKERLVLNYVAQGETKLSIAELMGVTKHAVDFHFRNILKKNDTSRIVVAVANAVKSGLI
ncbi:hypothetical protein AB833_03590 [Chromatiales bacterium (ex Bugula neritina AB1)]|nr:hypothetical protein AB833_03590 [Chromatiales bacterium (ex Bugula neritina AB1)]